MKLLRILTLLGRADQSSSEQMYDVIQNVMINAGGVAIDIGHAIMYECVRTVTTIYPNTALLDAAIAISRRFIQSEKHNIKSIGVSSLASIVKDHPLVTITSSTNSSTTGCLGSSVGVEPV